MKTKFFLFFTWVMLIATSCFAENTPIDEPEVPTTNEPSEPSEPAGDKKVLVVYFSHTGNTRTIAGYIHNAVKNGSASHPHFSDDARPRRENRSPLLHQRHQLG